MISVLLVDDEPALLEIGQLFLEKKGDFAVTPALSADDALRTLENNTFDIIVSDYEMPEKDGITFLREIRAKETGLPFIIFTGRGREEVVIEAIESGADFYIQKGGNPTAQFAELAQNIKKAVEKKKAEDQHRLDEMRQEALLGLYRRADKSTDEIINYALERAVELTKSRFGFIAAVLEGATKIEIRAWSEGVLEACNMKTMPKVFSVADSKALGKAVRCGKPVIINEYNNNEGHAKGIPEGHMPITRHLDMPVVDGEEITLLASVANKDFIYDDGDVRQLELLMNGLWQLIKRRRYEEEILASNEQLKAAEATLVYQYNELHEKEVLLSESEKRLKLAIEIAKLGIFDVNMATEEMTINTHWENMLGYQPGELPQTRGTWLKLVHPEDLPDVLMIQENHLKGLNPYYEAVYRMKTGDGSWRWIHSLGSVTERTEEGEPFRLTGIQWDVTEIRRYQTALHDMNTKNLLLSGMIRHDILNQMTAIKGYLEILDSEKHEDLTDIYSALSSHLDTIQRMIFMAGDYQDPGKNQLKWHDISEIVTEAAEAARSGSPEGLCVDVPAGGVEIFSDNIITPVFFNLFDNAYRHGKGITHITIGHEMRGGGGVLIFEDNGTGVPKEDKERIFSKGYGNNSGMGLYLMREILGTHGMGIVECGNYGEGARFELFIPEGKIRLRE